VRCGHGVEHHEGLDELCVVTAKVVPELISIASGLIHNTQGAAETAVSWLLDRAFEVWRDPCDGPLPDVETYDIEMFDGGEG
jgi:hypothetical protein